jgi:predicted acetyltransferase
MQCKKKNPKQNSYWLIKIKQNIVHNILLLYKHFHSKNYNIEINIFYIRYILRKQPTDCLIIEMRVHFNLG